MTEVPIYVSACWCQYSMKLRVPFIVTNATLDGCLYCLCQDTPLLMTMELIT